MNATRQDAWTNDEDIILAETVLRYIREGKTQLEAFKDVAKQLSRTSAACGFRWNATIRKQYQNAIHLAKEERKKGNPLQRQQFLVDKEVSHATTEKSTIETAISILEKMKSNYAGQQEATNKEQENLLLQLRKENEIIKGKLTNYESAWEEMGNIWRWAKEKNSQ